MRYKITKPVVCALGLFSLLAVAFCMHLYDMRQASKTISIAQSVIYANMLESYRIDALISKDLAREAVASAKCKSDLHATAQYDELKHCLKDAVCAGYLPEDVQQVAPELFADRQDLFTHYDSGQTCK